MGWFKNKVRRWLNDNGPAEIAYDIPSVKSSNGANTRSRGFPFKMIRADSGYVIETEHFDTKTHDCTYRTYIITDNDNMAEKLSEIIVMETLRR